MTLEPAGLAALLSLTLIGVGIALLALPVGTCKECGHCKLEKLQRELETESRSARLYGVPRCGACGRHHDPSEDHPSGT
ncbi:MAG TPA: hypothetical protein VFX65_05530 [Candidatus Limnocylindrales bacterium]|nr:hypothetical protein [Candidatus Limnocylindrales bacterium]